MIAGIMHTLSVAVYVHVMYVHLVYVHLVHAHYMYVHLMYACPQLCNCCRHVTCPQLFACIASLVLFGTLRTK